MRPPVRLTRAAWCALAFAGPPLFMEAPADLPAFLRASWLGVVLGLVPRGLSQITILSLTGRTGCSQRAPLGGSADATARLETVIPAAAAGTRVAAAIFLVIFIGGVTCLVRPQRFAACRD